MKIKLRLLFLLVCCISFLAFVGQAEQNRITAKELKIRYPKSFPKPVYTFSANTISVNGFVLGRMLFYDPILSRDSTINCESCHQRAAAFAHIDHALSHGIDSKIGTRNVPSIQNLIWNTSFMWDGGVNNMEIQPINPISNPIEMDMPLAKLVERLRNNPSYRMYFKKAFNDTLINSERILKALAQFTGEMISANSRYDRYMAGEDTLSDQEKSGLSIFREKCGSCHKEPLFTDNSYRNNGILPDTSLNDIGRGKITGLASDNYKFKVPTLRNIELTFPYMHDGRYRKLRDVLNHYGSIHGKSADADLNKIGNLSDKERKDIVAFLLCLTDRSFINDPKFRNPFRVY